MNIIIGFIFFNIFAVFTAMLGIKKVATSQSLFWFLGAINMFITLSIMDFL